MLILTRKIEEEVKIGSNITIKIISISDNQMKIGIDAPADVQIFRGEVYDKVKLNTINASQSFSDSKIDLSKYKIKKVR